MFTFLSNVPEKENPVYSCRAMGVADGIVDPDNRHVCCQTIKGHYPLVVAHLSVDKVVSTLFGYQKTLPLLKPPFVQLVLTIVPSNDQGVPFVPDLPTDFDMSLFKGRKGASRNGKPK